MATTRAVLIIGGSGYVGTHLALRLREGYKVFATYQSRYVSIPGVTFVPYNMNNRNWVKRIAYAARPDVVIFAAGSNDAALAELEPRTTEQIHQGGMAAIANVADIFQPKFLYLSNSYAFDGNRGNYHETDIVVPSSALGKAKVGGENFIRGKSLNYLILRSSPLIGRGNGWKLSWMDQLRMRLDRKERTEVLNSELQSYTNIHSFVDLVERLVESGPKNKTLHYGGLTKCTQYEFAKKFAVRFGYDPGLIVEKRLHKRPTNSSREDTYLDFSLNCTQTVESLKIKPLLLEESFDLLEKHLIPRL